MLVAFAPEMRQHDLRQALVLWGRLRCWLPPLCHGASVTSISRGRHAWCSGRAAATGRGGNDTTAQAAGNATEKRDGAVRAFSERSMRRMRAVRELLASQYDETLNNTAAEAVRIMYDRAAQVSHARRQAQSGVPVTNS